MMISLYHLLKPVHKLLSQSIVPSFHRLAAFCESSLTSLLILSCCKGAMLFIVTWPSYGACAPFSHLPHLPVSLFPVGSSQEEFARAILVCIRGGGESAVPVRTPQLDEGSVLALPSHH